MIAIKTKLKNDQVDSLIQAIYRICKTHPNLSSRPKKELFRAHDEGRFLIAVNNSKPIGWLLRVLYTKNVQELAAVYVTESYRSQGVFTKLLGYAFKDYPISILVTFNQTLAKNLESKIGFKKTTLLKVLTLTRGKFLLSRFNRERIKTILKHYQTRKPFYLMFSNND